MRPRFRRLEFLYLTALGCIALAIVVSQMLIQTSINRQQDDARVINVAGRQRMLSQRISKLALKIRQSEVVASQSKEELSQSLELWKKSHEGLLHGDTTLGLSGNNSAKIISMFKTIEPHYQAIYRSAKSLLRLTISTEEMESDVAVILENEASFLKGMDEIVFQYDNEAQHKVYQLKYTELYLFLGSLFIIVLELIFVFRPLAKNIRKTVAELQDSEGSSKKMAGELSKLYEELEKSYQDLEAVNIKPESPSIYATVNGSGDFSFLSQKFIRLMEYEELAPPASFTKLLLENGYQNDFVEGVIQLLNRGENWSGEIRLTTEPGDFCWLEIFLVPTGANGQIKMIAKDVTEFKEAKMRSREINRERIEQSVKEQKYRSFLILEGQEEERKRLSRELHDGVGQMLSAMKLLLESVFPSSKVMQMRLEDARSLMKSIIQEVRRVSFNLTPSSLDDFGLVASVTKFCDDINNVTKTKVIFENETKFINRLESRIETNLYRIIQEAVNNALKYAKASKITVRFSHSINTLSLEIMDDGKGFDYSRLIEKGHFESPGHGIFNMKERTSFIGGVFDLDTKPDKGTKILITLSLDKND